MDQRKEILSLQEVQTLVNEFYARVQADELLKDLFNDRIQDRWPLHLEKMYRFWQTILLGEHRYHGSPFAPHANMPLEHQHFERWMQLFTQTVDRLFQGPKAEEAKWRAARMAELFEFKIGYFRQQKEKALF
jgi:hemoglobin